MAVIASGPSGSLSFASTPIAVAPESSATVATSSTATVASSTHVTVTDTVAAGPPETSVYVKLSLPQKSAFGV